MTSGDTAGLRLVEHTAGAEVAVPKAQRLAMASIIEGPRMDALRIEIVNRKKSSLCVNEAGNFFASIV